MKAITDSYSPTTTLNFMEYQILLGNTYSTEVNGVSLAAGATAKYLFVSNGCHIFMHNVLATIVSATPTVGRVTTYKDPVVTNPGTTVPTLAVNGHLTNPVVPSVIKTGPTVTSNGTKLYSKSFAGQSDINSDLSSVLSPNGTYLVELTNLDNKTQIFDLTIQWAESLGYPIRVMDDSGTALLV